MEINGDYMVITLPETVGSWWGLVDDTVDGSEVQRSPVDMQNNRV